MKLLTCTRHMYMYVCIHIYVYMYMYMNFQGMKASTAEYWLLKEISNLDMFGQEMFHSKFGCNGVSMIGVGPHGITVYRNQDEETQK